MTISLILPAYNLIFSIVLLIVLIFLITDYKVFIFLSIVSLLTLTKAIGGNVRTVVQYSNIAILFYLFLKNYGMNFIDYPKLPRYVYTLFLLLFVSMITATFFSNYRILGIREIIRTTVFFIMIYWIYSLLRDNKDIRILLVSLCTAGLVFSIALIYGFWVNNFNIVSERLNSGYLNANGWGAFIMIIFSIALSFYLMENRRKIKIAFFILFIILFVSLLITNSRGAILGLVLSIMFLYYNLNKKLFKIYLFLILLIIPILFINPISDFIDLYLRIDKITTGRDIIWSIIYGIIKDNPILGVGPGATKYSLYSHLNYMLGSPAEKLISFHYNEIEFGHAHNFYLFFWTDLGILGLITSIFLPVSFFKIGYQNLQKLRHNNAEYYHLTMGIIASGLGLFIRGIYEWSCLISYGTISQDLPFWLIFIVLWYINLKDIKKEDVILSFK